MKSLCCGVELLARSPSTDHGEQVVQSRHPSGDDAILRGNPNRLYQSDLGHCPDDHVAHVQLPPSQPMSRGGRECVMVVVPSLAKSHDTHDRVVPAVIMSVVWLGTPDMTDGVDAPCHVMDQEHTNRSPPDEP